MKFDELAPDREDGLSHVDVEDLNLGKDYTLTEENQFLLPYVSSKFFNRIQSGEFRSIFIDRLNLGDRFTHRFSETVNGVRWHYIKLLGNFDIRFVRSREGEFGDYWGSFSTLVAGPYTAAFELELELLDFEGDSPKNFQLENLALLGETHHSSLQEFWYNLM